MKTTENMGRRQLLHDAMGGGHCFTMLWGGGDCSMILVQTRNFLDIIVKTCGEPDLPKTSSEAQTKEQRNVSPVSLSRGQFREVFLGLESAFHTSQD